MTSFSGDGPFHHSYADDTQLYMTMDHSNNNWRDGLARIQLCVSEIREWMNQNSHSGSKIHQSSPKILESEGATKPSIFLDRTCVKILEKHCDQICKNVVVHSF